MTDTEQRVRQAVCGTISTTVEKNDHSMAHPTKGMQITHLGEGTTGAIRATETETETLEIPGITIETATNNSNSRREDRHLNNNTSRTDTSLLAPQQWLSTRPTRDHMVDNLLNSSSHKRPGCLVVTIEQVTPSASNRRTTRPTWRTKWR
jgi:hypothetical protein